MNADPVVSGGASVPTSIVGTVPAPGTSRGFIVQLGRVANVNLNSVALTTIFTTPASGFTRCIVTLVVMRNSGGAACTTNTWGFGQTATPTDWKAAVNDTPIAGGVVLYPQLNSAPVPAYGTNVNFVVDVTAGGAATTGDFDVFGYYQ